MEEVRDPALSGRISVLTTELTYNQTTAFWRDWPLPSVQLVVANAQCLLNEHRTHATGHALECPAAPGSSNPMDLNGRFFLAKRTRCRTIQISIDHATNACTGTLEYTPYTHDITKARKHWALQTEQQSKFKSRTSQVSRVHTKGPALAPFSKGKGKQESSCRQASPLASFSGPSFLPESSHTINQQASLPSCTLHGSRHELSSTNSQASWPWQMV